MENTLHNLRECQVRYDNTLDRREDEDKPLDGNDLCLWLKETVDVKRLERGER